MSEHLAIHHDPKTHRFEADIEGSQAYLAYLELGQQTLDIYRVFVPNNLRRRGIAAVLTQHALEWAAQMRYEVIPSCSYVERYIQQRAAQEAQA